MKTNSYNEPLDGFDPGLAYNTYRLRKFAFFIAGVTAFFASLSFMVAVYAGSSLFSEWTGQQLFYGLVGAGIVATVTMFQLTLYSSSEFNNRSWTIFVMTAVAVSFAIITETGGGMQREDARMEARSSQSISMKSLQKTIDQTSENLSNNPYQSVLEEAYKAQSNAEYELSRCGRHASIGQWRIDRCVDYETRLIESNKRLIVRLLNQSEDAKHSSIETMSTLLDTARDLERDESFHIALIRAIKSALDISGDIASFILFLTTICIFEIALHYLGRRYAEARDLLLFHGYDLVRVFRVMPKQLAQTSQQQIRNKKETIKELSVNNSGTQPNPIPTLTTSDDASTVHHTEENLYDIIKDLIISQQLAPNVRALKAAMKKGGYFSDDIIRQRRAEEILDTLHCDTYDGLRVLLPNPEYSKSGIKKPKYILNEGLFE
jgi:hypothetical protein